MKKTAKWMMIGGGGFFVLGVASGVLMTVLSMSQAFASLGQTGVSDPRTLATAIGHTLMSSFVGLSLSALGFISLFTGLIIFLTAGNNLSLHLFQIETWNKAVESTAEAQMSY